MSVYKAIIDNNICLSFGRGLRSDAQLYFDVKETIEYADALQAAISSCSANPPHIHAIYNDDVAAIDFMNGNVPASDTLLLKDTHSTYHMG